MSINHIQFCSSCSEEEHCPFSATSYIGAQTTVGFDWDALGKSADIDPDTLFMAWTRFFATLYKRLIANGLSSEQFAKQFPTFQKTLSHDISVLKWAASQSLQRDVGWEGVSTIVWYRISIISTEAGVRAGLLLELQFPHMDNPNAYSYRSHFFLDQSDAAYPPNVQETPIEARIVDEGPCSLDKSTSWVHLVRSASFPSSQTESVPA